MLGQRIREERFRKGLSQAALSKEFSVTQQTINKWENNKSIPEAKIVKHLASFFGVTTDYLFGLSDIRNASDLQTRDVYQFLQFENITIKGIPLTKNDREAIMALLDVFLKVKEL